MCCAIADVDDKAGANAMADADVSALVSEAGIDGAGWPTQEG